MKKFLSIATAALLLGSVADARIDFYIGWELSDVDYSSSNNYDKTQRGVGFGGRIYTDATPELDIGGEVGFSHVETDSTIGGNILHAQFILKYHFSDNVEVFGGVGGAARGTPYDANDTNDVLLTGGLWSLGIGFHTDNDWRIEATYHSIGFSGNVDGVNQNMDTSLYGIHVGKSFDAWR